MNFVAGSQVWHKKKQTRSQSSASAVNKTSLTTSDVIGSIVDDAPMSLSRRDNQSVNSDVMHVPKTTTTNRSIAKRLFVVAVTAPAASSLFMQTPRRRCNKSTAANASGRRAVYSRRLAAPSGNSPDKFPFKLSTARRGLI